MTDPTPLPWREAARAAMYEAAQGELLARHGTTDVSFNYRWEHVTTVVTLALRLAGLTGADAEIVEAAAWLHDVRKHPDGNRHPIAGAAFARDFLPATDFPPGKIEATAAAIADHMGLWRDEPLTVLEAQVLWDADKLAKIGLTPSSTGRAGRWPATRCTPWSGSSAAPGPTTGCPGPSLACTPPRPGGRPSNGWPPIAPYMTP